MAKAELPGAEIQATFLVTLERPHMPRFSMLPLYSVNIDIESASDCFHLLTKFNFTIPTFNRCGKQMPARGFGIFSFWRVLQSSPSHSNLDWPTRRHQPAMPPPHSLSPTTAPNLPTIGPNDLFVKVVQTLLPSVGHILANLTRC